MIPEELMEINRRLRAENEILEKRNRDLIKELVELRDKAAALERNQRVEINPPLEVGNNQSLSFTWRMSYPVFTTSTTSPITFVNSPHNSSSITFTNSETDNHD